jgi:hypothetical protein
MNYKHWSGISSPRAYSLRWHPSYKYKYPFSLHYRKKEVEVNNKNFGFRPRNFSNESFGVCGMDDGRQEIHISCTILHCRSCLPLQYVMNGAWKVFYFYGTVFTSLNWYGTKTKASSSSSSISIKLKDACCSMQETDVGALETRNNVVLFPVLLSVCSIREPVNPEHILSQPLKWFRVL